MNASFVIRALFLLAMIHGSQALDRTPVNLTDSPQPAARPAHLTRVGGMIVFSIAISHGTLDDVVQVWRTDGTPTGTVKIKEFTGQSVQAVHTIADLDGRILFEAGRTLYGSDGTEGGTIALANNVKTHPLRMDDLVAFGGHAYFRVELDGSQIQFWRTDGTAAGTGPVVPPGAPNEPSSCSDFVVLGNTLYFLVDEKRLWKSDGTAAGTGPALDHGVVDVNHSTLSAFGDRLLFSGKTDTMGSEPWISDGTTAGTRQIADLRPGLSPIGDAASSSPERFTAMGATAYFWANASGTGHDLWRTDGTAAGTTKLASFISAAPARTDVAAVGSTLFFPGAVGQANNWALYKVDGDSVALVSEPDPVGFPSSRPEHLLSAAGRLFYVDTTFATGTQIWSSDGTPAGSQQYVQLGINNIGYIGELAVLGSVLVAEGSDYSPHSYEAWRVPISTTPSIIIDAPTTRPTWNTDLPTIVVAGHANDDLLTGYTVSYHLSGATTGSGQATGTSTWSVPVSLNVGVTTVTVTITDASSASTTDTIVITRNDRPTTVSIDAPAADLSTAVGQVAFSGTASDADGLDSVTWNLSGATIGAGTATGTASWSFVSPQLAPGSTVVTVIARDGYGGSASASRTITYAVPGGGTPDPVVIDPGAPHPATGTGSGGVSKRGCGSGVSLALLLGVFLAVASLRTRSR